MAYNGGYSHNHPAWDSAYDSTWDENEEDEEAKSKEVKIAHQHNRQSRAARDMQNYRRGYPDNSPKKNLEFYQNKIPFEPNGEYIDFIHEHWRNRYDILESNHNFIQWLFPLRERGVNWHSVPLTQSEIEMMKKDKKVMERILESYRLMLGFYGIVLVDADTGMVARAEHNWEKRFDNLNWHTHNNLRITRILKCLGEMGYEKLQAPLVRFFLEETLCNGNLPNVKESALEYFMFAVKDKKERQKLVHFAWMNYKPQELFKWGPVDKLRKFNPLAQDAESKCDVPEEDQMITPKIESSEGYTAVGGDVSGRKPENRRNGLVRRVLGYIASPFLLLFRFVFWPFQVIFRLRPFCFLRGSIFWFRDEAKNEDGLNDGQISVKNEEMGTGKRKDANLATNNTSGECNDRSEEVVKSEHEMLLKNDENQKIHKGYGISEGSMEDTEKKAKLERKVSGGKYEAVGKDGEGSEDWTPLVYMSETRQGIDDSGKNTKFIKSTNVTTLNLGNEQLSAKESSEEEHNDTEAGEHSDRHTKGSRADKHGGTQTGNLVPKSRAIKIVSNEPKVRQIHSNKSPFTVGSWHKDGWTFGTVGSQHNDGLTTGTPNIFHDTDIGEQAERDDGKTEVECASNMKAVLSAGEKAENVKITLMEDDGKPSTLVSKDNDERNSGTQNTLPDTDKAEQDEQDDRKAEDGCVLFKMENNGNPLAVGLQDNGERDSGTQNTLLESDKTKQDEKDDEKAEDEFVSKSTERVPASSENVEICRIEDKGKPLGVRSMDNDERNTDDKDDTITQDEVASKVEPVPAFSEEGDAANHADISQIEGNGESSTAESKDNDGRNIWTQNTLSGTDKENKIERDEGASKKKPVYSFNREEYYSGNAEMIKTEGNTNLLFVTSKANDGVNIGTQHSLLETEKPKQVQDDGTREAEEAADNDGVNIGTQNTLADIDKAEKVQRDDGKTEDEEAANMAQLPQNVGETDKGDNVGISKKEININTRTMGSVDNAGENNKTQTTEPEKEKTEQDEGADHARADVSSVLKTEDVEETLESVGGSRGTVDREI